MPGGWLPRGAICTISTKACSKGGGVEDHEQPGQFVMP
jgi:hypothetical protein